MNTCIYTWSHKHVYSLVCTCLQSYSHACSYAHTKWDSTHSLGSVTTCNLLSEASGKEWWAFWELMPSALFVLWSFSWSVKDSHFPPYLQKPGDLVHQKAEKLIRGSSEGAVEAFCASIFTVGINRPHFKRQASPSSKKPEGKKIEKLKINN